MVEAKDFFRGRPRIVIEGKIYCAKGKVFIHDVFKIIIMRVCVFGFQLFLWQNNNVKVSYHVSHSLFLAVGLMKNVLDMIDTICKNDATPKRPIFVKTFPLIYA